MSSSNQSDDSQDAINCFIGLKTSLNETKRKLKKNKPVSEPEQIVFEGYKQLIKGMNQERERNEIDENDLKIDHNRQQKQETTKPANFLDQITNPGQKKGIQLLHYVNAMRNIGKPDPNKPKQVKYSDDEQLETKPKKSRKPKSGEKSRDSIIKPEKPSRQKSGKQKKVQQLKPVKDDKNGIFLLKEQKKPKKITYVPYDEVEMEDKKSQDQNDNKNVFLYFKNFQQRQKNNIQEQIRIKQLQAELAKQKNQQKKEKKDSKKSLHKDQKSKARPEAEKNEKPQQQVLLKPKYPKTDKKSQTQEKKQTPKPAFLNKVIKGKKEKIDLRKQTLRQIIETYNNKLKTKELNTRIFTNLFGNQIDFAIAYQTNRIDSSYFIRCILTPIDHRAVSIILNHKFPRQFAIDQSAPFPHQNGIPDELFIFYDHLYSLPQIEYYKKYLQIVIVYKRNAARSLRVTLDAVMKQKLKSAQTQEQKKHRKEVQQLLQRIEKNEKEQQLMTDIRRENQMRAQRQNQQRITKQSRKGMELAENPQQVLKKSTKKLVNAKVNEKSKKPIQGQQIIVEPQRRVIVIDERAKLLDLENSDELSFRSSSSGGYSFKSHSSQDNSQSIYSSEKSQRSSWSSSNSQSQSYSKKESKSSELNDSSAFNQDSQKQISIGQDQSSSLSRSKHERQSNGELSMGSDLQRSQEWNEERSQSQQCEKLSMD